MSATVYRNTRFVKRNYECTNVAACLVYDAGSKIPEGYKPADEPLIANMNPLWIEAGIQYWGWL